MKALHMRKKTLLKIIEMNSLLFFFAIETSDPQINMGRSE